MNITVSTRVNAKINKVWQFWTDPIHIVNWNFASDDWCCPTAINDLSPGGELNWRMEAKDGSMGFDFTGTYKTIVQNEIIHYEISDGRTVKISFKTEQDEVVLTETFDAEDQNSAELQKAGWQAILNNFKKYVEEN